MNLYHKLPNSEIFHNLRRFSASQSYTLKAPAGINHFYAQESGEGNVSPTIEAERAPYGTPTLSGHEGPFAGHITLDIGFPKGSPWVILYQSGDGVSFYERTRVSASATITLDPLKVHPGINYFYAQESGDENRSPVITVVIANDQNAGSNHGGQAPKSVGCPVNVTNGNMYLSQTDYVLPGRGESINVVRTYNSVSNHTSGIFGDGWTTQYDERIDIINDLGVKLLLPDGRAVYFTRSDVDDPFLSYSKDFYADLVKAPNGAYTLTFEDGRVHQFNSAGKLTSLTDRNSNQTILAYDEADQLTSITDPAGRVLTVTMSSDHITQLSDSLGVVADYTYYSNLPGWKLQEVTYADGSKFKFEYSSTIYKLTVVKDALNNILESHQYDSSGRATTSEKDGGVEKYTIDYSQANTATPFTTVTDALGRKTKYHYAVGPQRVVTRIEGNCDCGNASETASYEYDDRFNMVKEIDALLNETSYTHDENGNVLTMTDVFGTQTYTYNFFRQILTATDRMGGVVTNTYDARGNLLTTKDPLDAVTTFAYNTNGQLISVKNAKNFTTAMIYDAQGRMTQVTDANNKLTRFAYDARDRTTSTTNALNETISYEYDANNRVKKVIYPDTNFQEFTYDLAGRRTQVKDEKGNITSFAYDNAYRLTSVTDALNNTASNSYDLMSNLVAQTDGAGNVTNYEYDDFDRLTKVIYPAASSGATRLEERFEYDKAGNRKKHIDTANREMLYAYDNAHRLVSTTDALNQVTRFEYNARSQMTKVTDALNQEYLFTYDPLGRRLSQSRDAKTMSYQYDLTGNLVKRTDYSGRVTDYTYDNLNRLTLTNYVTQPDINVTNTYDDLGRMLTAVNNAGTVTFAYDNRGRLISENDVHDQTVGYRYEANGNRAGLLIGIIDHATYAYDAGNRLTSLTSASDKAQITFGYDNANRMISKNLPNGINTTYEYDGLSRLTRLKDASTETTHYNRQYAYNTANQISQITEPAATRNFSYDNIDRLTGMTSPTLSAESYAYDSVGNRTSSHLSASYTNASFNRLTATANASYTY